MIIIIIIMIIIIMITIIIIKTIVILGWKLSHVVFRSVS